MLMDCIQCHTFNLVILPLIAFMIVYKMLFLTCKHKSLKTLKSCPCQGTLLTPYSSGHRTKAKVAEYLVHTYNIH